MSFVRSVISVRAKTVAPVLHENVPLSKDAKAPIQR